MSFYICHCGNTENNHHFRHTYENRVKVEKEVVNGLETFTLDSTGYPIKSGIKCGRVDCKADIGIHNSIIVKHNFEKVDYSFRELNFCLPEETVCHKEKCLKALKDHKKVLTHRFKTKVVFLGKEESDIVNVFDTYDEDLKIDF